MERHTLVYICVLQMAVCLHTVLFSVFFHLITPDYYIEICLILFNGHIVFHSVHKLQFIKQSLTEGYLGYFQSFGTTDNSTVNNLMHYIVYIYIHVYVHIYE